MKATTKVTEAAHEAIARLTREGLVVNWAGISPDGVGGEVTVGPLQFALIGGELKAEGYEEMPELSVFTPEVGAAIKILFDFGYRLQISKFRRPDSRRFDYNLEAVLRSWKESRQQYGVLLSLKLKDEYFERGVVEALLTSGSEREKPKVQTFPNACVVRVGGLKGHPIISCLLQALEERMGPHFLYFQLEEGNDWLLVIPGVWEPSLENTLTRILGGAGLTMKFSDGSGAFRL